MIKKILFLWLNLFFLTTPILSQAPKDTLVASQYYQKGDSLLIDRKYKESIVFFKKALLLYKKAETWEKVANCYNKVSENQWRTRKIEESLRNAGKALEIGNVYLKKDNLEEAYAYYNIGNTHKLGQRYKESLLYLNKALTIRQKKLPKNHKEIANSYNVIGIIHYYKSEHLIALEYYKKALEIRLETLGPEHKDTAASYNNIGTIYRYYGKLFDALEYYKLFLDITIKHQGKHHFHVGSAYMNIGNIYEGLNQIDIALDYYNKALPIFVQEKQMYPLGILYGAIGNAFALKGEYNKAILHHKKSLDVKTEILGDSHVSIAKTLGNFGSILSMKGEKRRALEYLKKSLRMYKSILGGDHFFVGLNYKLTGVLYVRMNEYETGKNYLEKSKQIFEANFGKNSSNTSDIYQSIAYLLLKQNMYEESIKYYKESLDIIKNIYGDRHLLTSDIYYSIALIYHKQKKYSKAISYFDRAFLANLKNKDVENVEDTLDVNAYYDLGILLKTLHGKAKTLQSRFQKNKDKENLEQSIALYQQADLVINSIRHSYQNYQDKVTLAKKAKETYADAINAHLLVYEETQEQSSLSQMFYYIEKSKANILKELLNDSYAKTYTGLPDELLAIEKTLKTNRAFYNSQINAEQSNTLIDTLKIKEYENELFDINRKQDSLIRVLEKEYPKYHQLKYKNDIISLSEIQENLDDKTTVLEFFTNDSITYAFTISKNLIAVKELTTANLSKKVSKLHESITLKNTNDYKQSAFVLYQELITPIKDKLIGDELIIIPDGPLWHLNFELLLTQNNEAEVRKMPYLLRDYAISYANSANLLFNPLQRASQFSEIRNECLAFSFSDSTQLTSSNTMSLATLRGAGDDLPGTRKEIRAISTLVNGQYFYGSEAIESNFKQNVNQYSILHLALHGDVDHKNPQNSKLYFTKSKDTIEDNLLYSHELFALDIPAELAVLSACNTGTGAIARGEGIMSLGNAFQYAGTKSLLLSSWEVSDKSAPVLIKNFYTNLSDGMNKSKALRKAKLDFLKTTDFDQVAPFYWGSFYLLGNVDAIDLDRPLTTYWYWVVIVCVLLLFTLTYVFYRKRSQ